VTYTVVIEESDEGFSASMPGLAGCNSQGITEEETIANIRKAIREYLEVVDELSRSVDKKLIAIEV
jgi:predicted RNase H-like HicB family nuclease